MKQVLSIINKSLKAPLKKKDSFKTPQALCQHLISITINVMTFKTMKTVKFKRLIDMDKQIPQLKIQF